MFVISYLLKIILVYIVFRYSVFGLMVIRKAHYQISLPSGTALKTFGTFVLFGLLLFVHLFVSAFIITDENSLFSVLNLGLFIYLSIMIFYQKKCKHIQYTKPVEKMLAVFTGLFFYIIFMFNAFEVDLKNMILIGLNAMGVTLCVLNEYQKKF